MAGSLTAGPAFLIAAFAESLQSGAPSTVRLEAFGTLIFIAPIAAVVGFFVAIIPVSIGCGLYLWIGGAQPLLKFPVPWAVVGGLGGLGIGYLFDYPTSGMSAAFGITGAVCALISCASLDWNDHPRMG